MGAQSISLFGQLLKRYRTELNFSQEELAERAALSSRAISDLERGVKRSPRKDTVRLLADALMLSPQKRALFASVARPTRVLAQPPRRPVHLQGDLIISGAPLIGRERELLGATKALSRSDVRLLTLTGPGGVGKTRIAWRLATELLDDYEDGVFIVSLAPARDMAVAVSTIVRALGLREDPERTALDQLIEHLRARRALLVLDNMEHLSLLSASMAALLASCPGVRILATSREPLRIRGEHVAIIPPLDLDYAVRLFLETAQAVNPLVACGEREADIADIRAICEQLDCLPLALELAAARTISVPLTIMRARLGQSLSLLVSGPRDLPERQRTMRSAIAWSVNLLEMREQDLFARLSVFVGGWGLDAAYQICGAAGESQEDVFDRLATLTEKSVLQLNTTSQSDPRFRMLETLRQFAGEVLASSNDEAAARALHAAYFTTFAEQVAANADHDMGQQILLREADNLRAALRWTKEFCRPDLGMRLVASLARMWFIQGFSSEAEIWMAIMLELDDQFGHVADPRSRLDVLYGWQRFALQRRDYGQARQLAQQSLEHAELVGETVAKANALATLGHVAEAAGNYQESVNYLEQSLALSRHMKDLPATGRALSSLGNLARAQGEYERAAGYLGQSLAIARELHMAFAVSTALTSLGHVSCEQADYARAAHYYRECLDMHSKMPNEATRAWLLEGVVVVAAAGGHHVAVAQLCGSIATLRQAEGAAAPEWRPVMDATARSRALLTDRDWSDAFAEGQSWPVAQVIERAQVVSST